MAGRCESVGPGCGCGLDNIAAWLSVEESGERMCEVGVGPVAKPVVVAKGALQAA